MLVTGVCVGGIPMRGFPEESDLGIHSSFSCAKCHISTGSRNFRIEKEQQYLYQKLIEMFGNGI